MDHALEPVYLRYKILEAGLRTSLGSPEAGPEAGPGPGPGPDPGPDPWPYPEILRNTEKY